MCDLRGQWKTAQKNEVKNLGSTIAEKGTRGLTFRGHCKIYRSEKTDDKRAVTNGSDATRMREKKGGDDEAVRRRGKITKLEIDLMEDELRKWHWLRKNAGEVRVEWSGRLFREPSHVRVQPEPQHDRWSMSVWYTLQFGFKRRAYFFTIEYNGTGVSWTKIIPEKIPNKISWYTNLKGNNSSSGTEWQVFLDHKISWRSPDLSGF